MSDRGSNMVAAFTNPMVLCPNDDLDEYIPLKEFERLLNEMSSESLEDEMEDNIGEEADIVEIINEFTADVENTNTETEREFAELLEPEEEWIGCCAHMIHNCVSKALQVNDEISSFKKHIQHIIAFFQVRNQQLQSMRSQTGKKLIKSIAIRWNSFVAALERLTEVETWNFVIKALKAFLNDAKKTAKGRKAIEEGKYPKLPGHTELLKAKELIDILQPLKEASNILQADTPTASLVIPTIVTAYKDLIKLGDVHYFGAVRKMLLSEIKKAFEPVLQKLPFVLATVLDPRIKSEIFPRQTVGVYSENEIESHFVDLNLSETHINQNTAETASECTIDSSNEDEEGSWLPQSLKTLRLPCQQHVIALTRKHFHKAIYSEVAIVDCDKPGSSRSGTSKPQPNSCHGYSRMLSGWKQKPPNQINAALRDEIDEYLTEPLQDTYSNNLNKEFSLQYWKHNNSKWHYLSQYARKYLAIPASSGTCERLFSILINIGRARRSEIKVDTMEKLIFIKENVFRST